MCWDLRSNRIWFRLDEVLDYFGAFSSFLKSNVTNVVRECARPASVHCTCTVDLTPDTRLTIWIRFIHKAQTWPHAPPDLCLLRCLCFCECVQYICGCLCVFFFLCWGLWVYIIALFTFLNFMRGCFLTFNHYFPTTSVDAACHALHFPEQADFTWSETGGPATREQGPRWTGIPMQSRRELMSNGDVSSNVKT